MIHSVLASLLTNPQKHSRARSMHLTHPAHCTSPTLPATVLATGGAFEVSGSNFPF